MTTYTLKDYIIILVTSGSCPAHLVYSNGGKHKKIAHNLVFKMKLSDSLKGFPILWKGKGCLAPLGGGLGAIGGTPYSNGGKKGKIGETPGEFPFLREGAL
jgi:hypothetical protein